MINILIYIGTILATIYIVTRGIRLLFYTENEIISDVNGRKTQWYFFKTKIGQKQLKRSIDIAESGEYKFPQKIKGFLAMLIGVLVLFALIYNLFVKGIKV